MNKISGSSVFSIKRPLPDGQCFEMKHELGEDFFPCLVSQGAEPSFSMALALEPSIVWKSHFQPSTVRMSTASAGCGAADSCTHQTLLPHYITPLLKPFHWLSVMQQIYFKVCGPYTAWNGLTCTLNTA